MTTNEYKKILNGLSELRDKQFDMYGEDFINPHDAEVYTDGVLEGIAIAIRFIRDNVE